MGEQRPTLLWLRRDLRLADHPALTAAVARGGPVIPVFVHDEVVETMGAAPRFRLGEGLAVFARALEAAGSRLILRRGRALEVLRALLAETGAGASLRGAYRCVWSSRGPAAGTDASWPIGALP